MSNLPKTLREELSKQVSSPVLNELFAVSLKSQKPQMPACYPDGVLSQHACQPVISFGLLLHRLAAPWARLANRRCWSHPFSSMSEIYEQVMHKLRRF